MNLLTPVYTMADFVYATSVKLEDWRMQQQCRNSFPDIDSHTLQDIGIRNIVSAGEVCCKRACEK